MESKFIQTLGVKTNVLTFDEAVSKLEYYVDLSTNHYVCVNSAQDIMISQENERFKHIINNSTLAIPDGMPLIWLSKLSGYKDAERVTGPDLMLAMCERSETTGHSHFFYGGKEDVPGLLLQKLKGKFPALRVAGCYSPPFRPLTKEEDNNVVKMINESKADFLWVGLGTPKQQYWIDDHIKLLNISVIVGVGAAFDYHSGKMKRAPIWMQRNGLEWLFRLTHYPGPVWKRYAKYIPKFVLQVGLERIKMCSHIKLKMF